MGDIATELKTWFEGRLPKEWFASIDVQADSDEILVVGTLAAGDGDAGSRIDRFREDTREQRIAIGPEAEHLFNREVSWGAAAGETRKLSILVLAPGMTRLRLPERAVLDTLV